MAGDARLVAGALAASVLAAVFGTGGVPFAWPASVLLLGVAGLLWVRPRCPELFVPLAVALAVRATVAVLHWTVLPLPDDHMDAVTFDRVAWGMAQGPVQEPAEGAFLYSWLLSFAYRVMGHEPFAAEGINVLLGTSIVLTSALLARELWGQRAGRATAWATALFPTLILYSVVLMREATLVAPMVAGAWTLVLWWRRPQVGTALATAALWVLPALMQPGLKLLFPAAVVLAAARPLLQRASAPNRVVLVALFVPLYLVGFAGSAMGLWDSPPEPPEPEPLDENATQAPAGPENETAPAPSEQEPPDGEERFNSVHTAQLARTHGRAAYPVWMVVDSWLDAILLGPARLVMLLFAPFPWMVTTPKDLLGLLDSLLLVAVAAGLWRGRSGITGSGGALVIASLAAIGLVIYSMGTSNYGTGIRHRAKFVPLLLALLPEQAWQVRLPGRPEGSTLLGDLMVVQARVEERLSPRARRQ